MQSALSWNWLAVSRMCHGTSRLSGLRLPPPPIYILKYNWSHCSLFFFISASRGEVPYPIESIGFPIHTSIFYTYGRFQSALGSFHIMLYLDSIVYLYSPSLCNHGQLGIGIHGNCDHLGSGLIGNYGIKGIFIKGITMASIALKGQQHEIFELWFFS